MGLLQETCDAIRGRSHEIEQHIIDSWNAGSPVEQYKRLKRGGSIWCGYKSGTLNGSKALHDYCLCRSWRGRYGRKCVSKGNNCRDDTKLLNSLKGGCQFLS